VTENLNKGTHLDEVIILDERPERGQKMRDRGEKKNSFLCKRMLRSDFLGVCEESGRKVYTL
jgi:hypothetical protein